MPRAISSFSEHAFQRLGVHRLYATPFSFNNASHRSLEKAGFEREGVLRHHHCKHGTYIDAIIYGRISDSTAKGLNNSRLPTGDKLFNFTSTSVHLRPLERF